MKIGIIGAGNVGSATAFALMIRGVSGEIVLIDYNKAKAEAEAEDIFHATTFSNTSKITAGDYDKLKGTDIVIITAGANQKTGQTRTDLLATNVKIFESIVSQVVKYAPDCIIIVASNPVDVMTHVTLELSGFPSNRVFGTGTVLDTSRFRAILGEHLGVSPQSIHANVLGEHGDSEVVIWSNADVANENVMHFAESIEKPLTNDMITEMTYNVVNAAYKIIEGKGSTFYGIAGCIARLCRAIGSDEHSIFTISSLHKDAEGIKDVCVSYPTVLGKSGVCSVVHPEINEFEKNQLKKSIETVKHNSDIALNLLKNK